MRPISQLAALAAGLFVTASAYANVTYSTFIDPATSVSFDGWNSLNRAGMGGGDQTIATAALVNGFTANVAGSGDAVLKRLSGSVYPAGAGLYGTGVLNIADSVLPTDIDGIKLQGIINDFSGTFSAASLALSYNGGSQALTPTLETFTSTGAVADYYLFTWDLTSIGSPITSYSIDVTLPFTQTLALQADAVSPVPEPTVLAIASLAGLGLLARRRQKATQ